MADESFAEVQLKGKQLIFLFMAGTVMAVVIFLCGIMVGRGVRAQRGEVLAAESTGDPTTDAPAPSTPISTASAASVAAGENLSYPERLGTNGTPPETLNEPDPTSPAAIKASSAASAPDRQAAVGATSRGGPSAASPAAPLKAATEKPASSASAAAAVPFAATSSKAAADKPGAPQTPAAVAGKPAALATPTDKPDAPGSGQGFAVQVAAVPGRAEAERVAKRLSAKGYAAYVTAPTARAPHVFRVRVGKFKDRHEAESVARRLQRDERFKPWITR